MTHIESRQNGTIKHLVRLAHDKKYRISTEEIFCEGAKMLEEALQSGAKIKTVLLGADAPPDMQPLVQRAEAAGATVFCAPNPLLRQVSDVQTPQHMVFSCVPPSFGQESLAAASRILVLDGVQDPGNMGTILRTADAFSLDAVVLGEGCVDPYAPKVIRATMGAIFRLPLVSLPLDKLFLICKEKKLPIYAAALAEDSVAVHQVPLSRCAIVIGNEGRGVCETTLQWCDRKIIIPMRGRAESLNAGVAAAVLMWEMTRDQTNGI